MATRVKYDEAEIIEQLHKQATCRAAFGKVIEHYSEQLYWHIRRMVIDHDDTNDVLQNTFIKAWTNIDNFRGDAKLSTWLYKIAINESITFINKKKVQNNISLDDDDSFLVNSLEADKYFDGDDAQIKLQKAISTLPEKQRIVFNMRYYDDLSFKEIAEAINSTEANVKANYHYAKEKIIKYMNSNS